MALKDLPQLDRNTFNFCNEFYVVVKSVEIVARVADNEKHIRIDALHSPDTNQYSTSSYVFEHVTLQPTYPQTNSEFAKAPESFGVWVSYDLPWTSGSSAEVVLAQALSFLRDRVEKSA